MLCKRIDHKKKENMLLKQYSKVEAYLSFLLSV